MASLILTAAGTANHLPAQTLSYLYQPSDHPSIGYDSGIALGPNGVYVTSGVTGLGQSAPDSSIRKLDFQGTGVWIRSMGGASVTTAVAVSNSAVYVAGNTEWDSTQRTWLVLPGQTAAGIRDAFVRKYDSEGKELWTRQFGETHDDYADSLAADASGVYVAGRSTVADNTAVGVIFLRKFDPDGNLLWKWSFDGAWALVHVAADASGVYVVGSYNGSGQPYFRKFDANGNFLWTRFADFGALAYVTGVAVNSRAVFIGGWFEKDGTTRKQFVRAYDLDGAELWTRLVPTPYDYDFAPGIQLAADERGVYFAGAIEGVLPGQCRAGFFDIQVTAYDSSGDPLWTRQFGTNEQDIPVTLAAGSNGIYVAGSRPGSGFLAKLDSAVPQASNGPHIRNECVLNAANYVGGAIAPGEIVTILGTSLGPTQAAAARISEDSPLPTTLAGARVLFNGAPAPVLYASDQQITAIVPYGLDPQAAVDVQVEYLGQKSGSVRLPLVDSRLGVFSLDGSGQGPPPC